MTYAFDPELVPFATPIGEPSGDIATSRALVQGLIEQALDDADLRGLRVDDRVVPGPEDAPELLVRVYAPVDGGTTPGVLYIHGGGFTVGSIDLDHPHAAELARAVGATVVSVEYRLAPEHPYPAAIHDCYAALTWFHDQAAALDVDADRIAVVGSSAGGGLAAGLALYARDRGGPRLCFQFLGIPELDHRLETQSMLRFTDTPMWSRALASRSWTMYLGDRAGDVEAYASPAVATDLAGLPPTYISTMEFDPMRDEGIHYALALLAAGVSVELHSFPGTFHGCNWLPSAVSTRINDEMVAVLRRAFSMQSATTA